MNPTLRFFKFVCALDILTKFNMLKLVEAAALAAVLDSLKSIVLRWYIPPSH